MKLELIMCEHGKEGMQQCEECIRKEEEEAKINKETALILLVMLIIVILTILSKEFMR